MSKIVPIFQKKILIKEYQFKGMFFVIDSFEKGTALNDVGNFFRIFDTSLPHVGSFLVLSVDNFDPSQLPTSFMDGPQGQFQWQTFSKKKKLLRT